MTDNSIEGEALPTAEPRRGSKAAAVLKLISRTRGATMAELIAESGWQAHTVRAHLSGLRKKHVIMKETRRSGEATYRMTSDQAATVGDDQID
jgi:hypothetical protein